MSVALPDASLCQVDHELKIMFEDLKDGARIFSSKAFSPVHFRITGEWRNRQIESTNCLLVLLFVTDRSLNGMSAEATALFFR